MAEEEHELDATQDGEEELDAAMQEAVAAVEEVERKHAGKEGESSHPKAASPGEEEEVERLRQEVASLRDISMRTLADFDNYRKRVERERAELRRYALVDPLREFLPVVDNLDRALAADGKLEDLRMGLQMVHRQMIELLERFDARQVPAKGEPFDPNVHEAVSRLEEEGISGPTVREEHQKGYTLHDRLLRPAMVTVAMPASPAEADGTDED